MDERILNPIDGDDPCGPDLRWDPLFLAVGQALDNVVAQDGEAVVEGELAAVDTSLFDEIDDGIGALMERTKDLRLLAIRAEANWRRSGLASFTAALEDFVVCAETWPDPHTGVHPRADEDDGDLGERAAVLGRLLNRSPSIAASTGWGAVTPNLEERADVSGRLRAVFDHWTARLEAAFGADLPPRTEAWNAIKKLTGNVSAGDTDPATGEDETGAAPAAQPVADAWECVERAVELMAAQDRHSPALPVLRMLAGWRSLGIIEISTTMRASGVSLEQLLDSISKQLAQP